MLNIFINKDLAQ